mmetsp:Transcript_5442/g.10015  ORF Transcript_5442/g.10015 Transcript_5442/m.10015 type:complete len:250 (-) Transcript_5442:444-1193(-)|eukprot:CAMPEP_0197523386 /NCGR_PEP_ID=MMETSP1318-20131121/8326_1 /TAXON_ID=552666 /ORGANISM="Partenskyella glossopodia, Strain RCC365" /LENGTH=249 /DNA_ID=CAMNT_0043076061 /DNA_START=148 /DNA_END=897 /DNA_ORIENTATION=+
MEELFKAMDLDGDGLVTPKEIGECLQMLNAPPQMVATEVATLMTRDKDGDGALNKEEFTIADYSVAGKSASWLTTAITKQREAAEKKKKFMEAIEKLEGAEKFEYLFGPTLVGGEGKEVSTKSVVDGADYVAVYMSAHWCGPCRRFTPMFSDVYKKIVAAGGKKLATVFVSCDRDKKAFDDYFGSMPWHAVPFKQGSDYIGFESKAGQCLDCNGIPKLGIFDKDAKLVSGNGVSLVYEHKENFLDNMTS